MYFNILDFPPPNAGCCRISRSPDHSFCSADPGVHQSDILPPPQPSSVSTWNRAGITSDSATVAPSVHRSQAFNHETAHEPDRHFSHHRGQHAIEPWGSTDQLHGHHHGGRTTGPPGEPVRANPAAAVAAAADAADATAAAAAAPDASADPAADAAAAFPASHAAAAAAAAQPAAAAAAAPTAAPAAAAPAHAAPISAFPSAALPRHPADDVPAPGHRESPASLSAAPVADTVSDTDSSATTGQYFLRTLWRTD